MYKTLEEKENKMFASQACAHHKFMAFCSLNDYEVFAGFFSLWFVFKPKRFTISISGSPTWLDLVSIVSDLIGKYGQEGDIYFIGGRKNIKGFR